MTQGSWCLEQWEEECYQWDSVFVGDPPHSHTNHATMTIKLMLTCRLDLRDRIGNSRGFDRTKRCVNTWGVHCRVCRHRGCGRVWLL